MPHWWQNNPSATLIPGVVLVAIALFGGGYALGHRHNPQQQPGDYISNVAKWEQQQHRRSLRCPEQVAR